jgi:hypothetical protein
VRHSGIEWHFSAHNPVELTLILSKNKATISLGENSYPEPEKSMNVCQPTEIYSLLTDMNK